MRWTRAALMALMLAMTAVALATPIPTTTPPPNNIQNAYTWCSDGTNVVMCQSSGGAPVSLAIAPIKTTALGTNLVMKTGAATLYSVYASNLTGGSTGFLQVFNAASAPADGAVTPDICVPFSTGGVASANFQGLPPASFSTGAVAVVSSDPSCFVKNTSTLTAFIGAMAR